MSNLSRRNFITGGAIAALGGTLALAGCAPKGEAAAASGVTGEGAQSWTGTSNGKGGELSVEVITEGDAIARINILKSRESYGVGTAGIDILSDLIVEHQTLNVDTVSGATVSSMAFLSAVSDAIDASGMKASDWKKRDKAVPQAPEGLETDVYVVVVGAGGAGYAAALTVAEAGKKVVLLEKLGITGGDTILSGGAMAVPGNWFQVKEGIDDSVEKMAEDMIVGGDNVGDPELVNVICQGAYNAMEWLIFEGGVAWQPYQRFFGGHSVSRSLIPEGNEGSGIICKLDKRAEALKTLTVCRNTKADELVTDASGAVVGLKATNTATGETYDFTSKAVILAAGGFGSNVEMRMKYNPEMDEKILSTDSVGATGDGHLMAEKIGANLIDMQYIQTYPTCDTQTGALLYVGNMRLENRAICINKEGDRFVEEMERRDVISNAIKEQTDGIGYMIFNQEGLDATDIATVNAAEMDGLFGRNQLVKGETIAEACEPFGIDAAELEKTVETWNGYCKDGADPDFNYRATLNPIEGGPYYILAYKPSVHYTMGGLHINPDAQVLDNDGAPIPGLFAAGEQAGHKMGTNRLGSCSITDVFVFGRVAGANAAALA
ncbi:flavocytochrome c [Eggerthella sinensis]|uniref:flavocytochrome c n=1 Tax=Eggerthella sinensis TaxID=242230 RepID=UPI001D064DC0|nr:flavocytochrome c [Eggerthella sinensis]MCB7036134.1 flavocytochrome c [Eggerthella sinensis]